MDVTSDDRIEVLMPFERGKIVLLPVDGEYSLCFYSTKGLFQCFAKIVDRYRSDNMYILVLDLTSELSKLQRREYYRFSCALELKSRLCSKEEQEAFENEVWMDLGGTYFFFGDHSVILDVFSEDDTKAKLTIDDEEFIATIDEMTGEINVYDDKKNCYIDGGMWSNSPVDVLNAGLIKSGWSNYKVLDLETGMDTPNNESGNKTLVGWAEYIFSDWVARSGKSGEYEVKSIIGEKNFMAVRPYVKSKPKMDDISDKTLDKVVELWEGYFYANKDAIKAWLKR
jgi:hypothetical protein